MKKIITELKEKYKFDFDEYGLNDKYNIWSIISNMLDEINFLNILVSRNKVELLNYKVRPEGKLSFNHWDMFQENINYIIDYGYDKKELLEDIFILLKFLDVYFYIDDTWDKNKALLLKKLLKEDKLEKKIQYYLGADKKLKDVLRDSSFYYKTEVWNEVKDLF